MTEWQLRILILLIGLAVIGLLYYFGTRRRQRRMQRESVLPDEILDLDSDGTTDAVLMDVDTDSKPAAAPVELPQPTGAPVLTGLGHWRDQESEAQLERRQGLSEEGILPAESKPLDEPRSADAEAAETPRERNEPQVYKPRPADAADPVYQTRRESTVPSRSRGQNLEADSGAGASAVAPPRPAPDRNNVVLLIRSAQNAPFRGLKLLTTLQAQDYALNDKNTWDYCPYEIDQPLFSVGHLKEPGSFDIATMRELETPGLVLFMKLPHPSQSSNERAVGRMIEAAARLSEALGGSLHDAAGRPLSAERQNELRAQAGELDRLRLSQ